MLKQHIFEVDGRFLQVLVFRVELAFVNSSFRILPVFLKYAFSGAHEQKQAFLEIEMLLGHLFRRNNTPEMWPRG